MKKIILFWLSFFIANVINAQITILDESVQEKVVSKPQIFDSLSNLTFHRDPIQYKQYIGYKLYCLPFSTNYKDDFPSTLKNEFKYKEPRQFVITTEQEVLAKDRKSMVKVPRYDTLFTDVYKAVSSCPKSGWISYSNLKEYVYTPFDSVQNIYFTILNIEIGTDRRKFVALEEYDQPVVRGYLRMTLKNESSGEELYWITSRGDFDMMFLVPYFEKMVKLYKGQTVVATTPFSNLPDVNTGEPVTINPDDICQCYNVTFVNLKDKLYVTPYFFLEKDGKKIMIPFPDFTKLHYNKEDDAYRNAFILKEEYDEIIAERNRAEEERKRMEEEKNRLEEQARAERNKQIMQKYGSKYGKLICDGQVCLNMTKDMCEESWGVPLYINSTIVGGKVFEQWIYGWMTYLYFDNGILKVIQN